MAALREPFRSACKVGLYVVDSEVAGGRTLRAGMPGRKCFSDGLTAFQPAGSLMQAERAGMRA